MVQVFIPLVAVVALGITSAFAFTPPGKYDLSLEELAPLCDMVKEFAETGQPPKPKDSYEPLKIADGGCIYYKWVPCATPSKDPKRPCGTYEMRKCEEDKKKKRSVLLEHSHHGHGHHDSKREVDEEQSVDDEAEDVGPVILGFPDEAGDFGHD